MDDELHYQQFVTQCTILKDRIRAVAHGKCNGLYLHGRPGTSKTYIVRTTLESMGVANAYANGHITPIGLFELLAENSDRVVVLDDVAALFDYPIALQLLLAAVGDQATGRKARTVRYKTAREDRVVEFTGGVIAISNRALKGNRRDLLHALNDRVPILHFEPTDEHIVALISKLADTGVRGIPPEACKMVATYLLAECRRRGIRPSTRLFVGKALPDYELFVAGISEAHWQDLLVSGLDQHLIELSHPTRESTLAEQIATERQIAAEVCATFQLLPDRLRAWKEKTGKSQAALYRRMHEVRQLGYSIAQASSLSLEPMPTTSRSGTNGQGLRSATIIEEIQ